MAYHFWLKKIAARREVDMNLSGKKIIALGERDGVQSEAISECVRSAGAEVVLQSTKCFV